MTTIADWLPSAVRDAPGGASDPSRVLDALLASVDEQVALLARDIDQVYDDAFVDSCSDWAVPYIGSLLGLPSDASRLEVANAMALRRRKGTPAALEDFAEVVSGWTARVLEGWQVTACAHRLGHPAGPRRTVFSFTGADPDRVGGPFDASQRVVSFERGVAPNGLRVTVWPRHVHTHHQTECAPTAATGRFALHPLGGESPMFLAPRPLVVSREPGVGRTGDESDAPVRVTYRVLAALAAPGDVTVAANWTIAATHPLADADPTANPPLLRLSAVDVATTTRVTVPWSALRFGSLPTGAPAAQPPAADEVVVDVHRGAVELGSDWTGPVRATWHRAVAGESGSLASTGVVDPAPRVVVTVNPDAVAGDTVRPTIAQAITRAEQLSVGLDPGASTPGRPDVEIRLLTSARLTAPNAPALGFTPTLPRWRIVAPTLLTPTVVGNLTVDLVGGCVSLEGFQITGDVRIGPNVAGVELRNLTMDPVAGSRVSVDPAAWGLELAIERCHTGRISADLAARPIRITDSIVDGDGMALVMCGPPPAPPVGSVAIAPTGTFPPMLELRGVTTAGTVAADSVDATDCLFVDGLAVEQTQQGCVRFSYLADSPDETLPVTHLCVARARCLRSSRAGSARPATWRCASTRTPSCSWRAAPAGPSAPTPTPRWRRASRSCVAASESSFRWV